MTNRLEQRCLDYGLHISRQRRIILSVIGEARDHPSAEDIHKRAIGIDPRISLATVYRTLNLLSETGLLSRVAFGDRKARYEEASEGHHEHLIDVETGKVIEFSDAAIETLLREAARRLGYRVLQYRLEIFGERDLVTHDNDAKPVAHGRLRAAWNRKSQQGYPSISVWVRDS